jgi:DNA-binding XRE family transcriptional regulator
MEIGLNFTKSVTYFHYVIYISKLSTFVKNLLTMDLKVFGQIVREKRNAIGLKQEELSQRSGVAIKTIHSIELGKGNPAIKTIIRIFDALSLDLLIVATKNAQK